MTTIQALPAALGAYEDNIALALGKPMLMAWDKERPFREADQPQALGEVLVEVLHSHLIDARIGYLFREKIEKRDRTVLAQASKVGGKLAYFSSLDLLVEVNWKAWKTLEPRQRVALIDHELSHFGVEEDDETGDQVFVMNSHDIEEFSGIVARWGLWKSDVADYHHIVVAQRELFDLSAMRGTQ